MPITFPSGAIGGGIRLPGANRIGVPASGLLGGRQAPVIPDPEEPAPAGFDWLMSDTGQYLRGADNEYLYGVAP